MRSPWNALIAALAVAALTCTVSGSNAVETGDRAGLRLAAGPGESTEPGGAEAVPGEAGEDEGPAASPGTGAEDSKPGGPGEKAEGKTAPPDSDEAGEADAKTTEAKPEEDATEAKETASEPDDDDETKTAEKPEALSAKSAAAAEKVKQGDIPVPTDPVALAAFHALEKNCARCHQAGASLKRRKPAKNFGNILQLAQIAREPSLVLPGNPNGSKIFVQLAKEEMPYDCYQEFDCKEEPTAVEVQAIYDWIEGLGKAVVAACGDRKPIDEEAIVTAIATDIDKQQEHRRKGMRYITLTNFYNACIEETDMVRYRQGVVKLLNSLSQESDVLKMRTVDPDNTIIAFNLDDLGWTSSDWDRIVSKYPYAMKPDATVYTTVAEETDTPLPWIRGDWLAFTASRPPLYYDLLKMPKTFAGLEKQLDVDVKSNIEKFLAKRAGFQISGVSKHNRLIERHSIPTGYFWTSYDFKGDKPEQSLFIHPLGPDGDNGFKHDGGETIFSLPNGFQAYYLNVASGERLAKGPTEIVLDDSQLDRAVTNGISCFGCHNQGIRQATDDVRSHVLGDRTFSKEVRTQVEALYPSKEEFKALLDEDGNRFRSAMKRAGLDPELDSQKVGVESINFLSKAYEKAIDLRFAAAEYGLAADALSQGLTDAGGEAGQLRRRLEQGVVPRETLEAQFKDLIVKVSDNEPIEIAAVAGDVATVGGKSKELTHDFDLALTSDKTAYKVDDLPVFSITSKEDCNLTLINVDSNGEGTVIFPNKFQQDNFLPAGKEAQFPGGDAPFQFRLKDPGTETVIAICNAGGKQVEGIKHDFKKRGFTDLGNYRGFVTRQIVAEGKDIVAEGQKKKAKDGATAKSEILARTAIKLEVK